MKLPTMFSKRVLNSSRRHAEKEFPNESVGIVVNGKYVALKNIAADPLNQFKIDAKELLKKTEGGDVQAFIHSHNVDFVPGTRRRVHLMGPSLSDMKAQLAWGIPFGIQVCTSSGAGIILWWGDGVPRLPYEGRPYFFGILDCFSIVRDWLQAEKGITVKDYARQDDFWKEADAVDLYLSHIRDEGFEQVALADIQAGDIILAQVGSKKVVNHAIVYLGGGQGLHHLQDQMSVVESIDRFLNPERELFHSIWRHKSLFNTKEE